MDSISYLLDDPISRPDPIPRYLYRTTTDRSRGENTPDRFRSRWAQQNNGSSIFRSLDSEAARSMVKHHLVWDITTAEREFKSDLISWSSTLMFALQHAVREHWHGKRNVQIYILDTWDLLRSDLQNLFPATFLVSRLGVDLPWDYSHEFLAVGKLRSAGRCDRIALEEVFKRFPHLNKDEEETVGLANEVKWMRMDFLDGNPTDFTVSYIARVRSLCEYHLHARFRLPFFLSLLTLEKRPDRPTLLYDMVRKWITTTNDQESLCRCVSNTRVDHGLERCEFVEMVQYTKLLAEVRKIYLEVQESARSTNKISPGAHDTSDNDPEDGSLQDDDTAGLLYESDIDSAEENYTPDDVIKRLEALGI